MGINYQQVNAGFLAPCISSMPVLLWVPGAPVSLFSWAAMDLFATYLSPFTPTGNPYVNAGKNEYQKQTALQQKSGCAGPFCNFSTATSLWKSGHVLQHCSTYLQKLASKRFRTDLFRKKEMSQFFIGISHIHPKSPSAQHQHSKSDN